MAPYIELKIFSKLSFEPEFDLTLWEVASK
jgi:hypothetical protein